MAKRNQPQKKPSKESKQKYRSSHEEVPNVACTGVGARPLGGYATQVYRGGFVPCFSIFSLVTVRFVWVSFHPTYFTCQQLAAHQFKVMLVCFSGGAQGGYNWNGIGARARAIASSRFTA
eukprot:TRINITY_DN18740_c0_g1_i1.p2 TRINITY_DN18740_c0_g1~~TRINITY_DN18740_c0_g1_i1.p2  ORF type:complete len:120 (+),score=9.18 TRINITY_DN18740_c0_g1_i1:699-1058(+)